MDFIAVPRRMYAKLQSVGSCDITWRSALDDCIYGDHPASVLPLCAEA